MKKTSTILFIVLSIFVLCSCGGNHQELNDAVNNKDVDGLVTIINTAVENDKTDSTNEALSEAFSQYISDDSCDLDAFLFLDTVIDNLDDSPIKDHLNEIESENAKIRLETFLSGEWIRKDGTDNDGIVGEIIWNNDSAVCVLRDVSDAINPEDFKENDLKWNNVRYIDGTTITGEDLMKSEGAGNYSNFTGVIDYKDNYISVHSVDSDKDYSKGYEQVWMPKAFYESYDNKQVLEKEDFKVSGEGVEEDRVTDAFAQGTLFHFFYFDPETDKNKESVITTTRGISLGSSKQDLIDKYGMGSLAFYDKKTDLFYRALGKEYGKYMKDAKYSIQYRTKDKKGWRITFYFDDKDEVIAIMYAAKDYSSIAETFPE